jgi:hypothetical protein
MEELFAIIGIVTLPLSIGFAFAWWNARKELRLRREIQLELGNRPHHQDTRHLEQSVEAIALEVERLAEAQRFVAKVLSERAGSERPRERPGSSVSPHGNTPH